MNTKCYFQGHACIYGNVDEDKDIIEKGAFNQFVEYIKNTRQILPLHWKHESIIGEIFMIYDTSIGLYISGEIKSNREDLYIVNFLKRSGLCCGVSIDMSIKSFYIDNLNRRHIEEAYIENISLVTDPTDIRAIVFFKKEWVNQFYYKGGERCKNITI